MTYDSAENKIQEINYWWDSQTNDWVGENRTVLAYDHAGNLIEETWYSWDDDSNDWIPVRKTVFCWSELTFTYYHTRSYDLNFNTYPNPTHGILTIETSQPGKHFIEITSLNGQLLYTDRMQGPTHQIDLSAFEKGLYFITIRTRDYVRTEKIIKQ